MMADFEKVDLDPFADEAKYERPDFAKVIFHNIAETYPTDAHIECCYVVTSSLVATSRDWVGLYKVGWSSSNDYVYFLWAPMPGNYQAGQEVENSVLFQAHNLPKDDGEFYQFCYVSSSGHVRGASTPFQFKKPSADDFITIEDEEEGMMVIKSKTVALEEDLMAAVREKEALQMKYQLLEEERESLLTKLVQTDNKLLSVKDKQEETEEKLELSEERVEQLQRQLGDSVLSHEALNEKLGFLEQEKSSILKRLDENEQYISSLQAKIKALINEKDALTGQCKTLEQEKEMLQNYFTNSESTVQSYKGQICELQEKLLHQSEDGSKQEHEVTRLKGLSEELTELVKNLTDKLTEREKEVDSLMEQLSFAEDKLAATDKCMQLRRDEVVALQQACDKISKNFEKARMEAHSYKENLTKLERQYAEERSVWDQQHANLLSDIDVKEKEKSYLNNELEQATSTLKALKDQKEVERQGAMFALRDAHNHLRKRYTSVKERLEATEKQLHEITAMKKEKEDLENDLRHEIRDLKERLSMGADEYKVKYLECRKLQAEVRRLKREARRSVGSDRGFGPFPGRAELVQTEAPSLKSASIETDPSLEMMTQTEARDGTNCTTQTESKAGAEITTQTIRAEAEIPTQTERQKGSETTTQTVGAETTTQTQTEKHPGAETMTQTDRKVESEMTTQTERKTESETMTQTMQKTELESMTQTDIRAETEIFTQTDQKVEAEMTTQTEVMRRPSSHSESQTDEADSIHAADQIQTELDDLGRELDQRFALQRRYQEMYEQEKAKNCMLQKMYYEELTKKNKNYLQKERECHMLQRKLVELSKIDQMEALSKQAAQQERLLKEAVRALDPLVAKETEDEDDEPYMCALAGPLPPPMQPEVLPAAREAAQEAAIRAASATAPSAPENLLLDSEETAGGASSCVIPTEDHEQDEERFEDADGEPQKLCPVCTTTFPADLPQVQFEQHVDSHYGSVCPMCSQQFPVDFEQGLFEEHVNSHFTAE